MTVTFYPYIPLNTLSKVITKEDGSPFQGETDIYKKLYHDLDKSDIEWYIWHVCMASVILFLII